MESRHEDILSEIKLGDPQSTLATARQCNIIPDLLKVPMKYEVSLIYIIRYNIYIVTWGNSGIDFQFLVAYAISTGITSLSNIQ